MRHIIKIILLAINLLLCGLLLLGAYSAYFPTRIGVLVELMFPINLIGCIAFILIWLIYKPKYIVVPTLAMALSWGGIARYCPINKEQAIDNSQAGFTLMTFNAYGFMDFERTKVKQNRTLAYILSQNADIVCLQEGAKEIVRANALKFTPELIDSIHARYPYRIDVHRLNLLSKYPAQLIYETNYSPSSMLAIYRIDIEGHTITLVNQHLESIGLTPTDKELYREITDNPNTDQLDDIKNHLLRKLIRATQKRNDQADKIAKEIADIPGTLIICGDFNDSPLSYSVHRFHRMGFQNAYNELGAGPGITYHANRFWFRIDHILYRGDIKAQWIQRNRIKISDHYPLVTRFVWNNPENSITQ